MNETQQTFKSFLCEMTMRGGNFDNLSDAFAIQYRDEASKGEHVGNIELLSVKKILIEQTLLYSIWDNDKFVSMLFAFSKNDAYEIRNIWVSNEYRNQKIMSKFLWFLKTREGFSKMILDPIHSLATQRMVTNGLSRFNKSWVKDDEKRPFNVDKLDDYSVSGPAGWQLMLENSGDFSQWPKYTTGNPLTFFEENYEWVVEDDV